MHAIDVLVAIAVDQLSKKLRNFLDRLGYFSFPQGLRLDLPDEVAGNAEVLADFFQWVAGVMPLGGQHQSLR